jgi:hypothetical protein
MILTIVSVIGSLAGISFSMSWFLFGVGVWVLFSTESLILAQDERWRRA